MHSSWHERNLSLHQIQFTYFTVCNLCENTKGFLHIGLLFSGQKAVVLQNAELCVSSWRLWP